MDARTEVGRVTGRKRAATCSLGAGQATLCLCLVPAKGRLARRPATLQGAPTSGRGGRARRRGRRRGDDVRKGGGGGAAALGGGAAALGPEEVLPSRVTERAREETERGRPCDFFVVQQTRVEGSFSSRVLG